MKKLTYIFFILCLISCKEEIVTENLLITIISDNSIYYGTQTSFSASSKGELKSVEFYIDGQSIGKSIMKPFSFTYTPLYDEPGQHTLSCIGTSQLGNEFTASKTLKFAIRLGDVFKGGKVFFIDESGNHGLIASTSDLYINGRDVFVWGTSGTLNTDLDNGLSNTEKMSIIATNSSHAAFCFKNGYNFNGYTDWYIPSFNELNVLKINKDYVGGFSTSSSDAIYWSSSEVDALKAKALNFIALMGGDLSKTSYSCKVRIIKKF